MYHNVDITGIDSMKFNMSVSGSGGVLEVRVGSATGNILGSEKIANEQQGQGFFPFGRSRTVPVKINTLGITGPQTIVLVYHEPEVPATDKETLEMAESADVALIFVGTDQTTGREESDRFALTLPGNQNELISAVAAVNPNTIVVMQTMGMVEVEQFKKQPECYRYYLDRIQWTGTGNSHSKNPVRGGKPGRKTECYLA